MEDRILGLHHVTAIAGSAQRNYDFYTKILGLRMVKKTVNFDDPRTYHFYYGDEIGSPGTILTFFPWEGITQGRRGVGMATETGYSVPAGSLEFWIKRFEKHNIIFNKPTEKFGELYLPFLDPDGLKLEFIVSKKEDKRIPWLAGGIEENMTIKGFHNVTLTLMDIKGTADVLTNILGYKQTDQQVNRYRFSTDAVENASIVDLVEAPSEGRGLGGGGTIHHVAFRVKDDNILMNYRRKVIENGLSITDKIDRNYFYSLYFREPGGVLFEIASDNPGFGADESLSELGTHLMLPPQYETNRKEIEMALPKLS